MALKEEGSLPRITLRGRRKRPKIRFLEKGIGKSQDQKRGKGHLTLGGKPCRRLRENKTPGPQKIASVGASNSHRGIVLRQKSIGGEGRREKSCGGLWVRTIAFGGCPWEPRRAKDRLCRSGLRADREESYAKGGGDKEGCLPEP